MFSLVHKNFKHSLNFLKQNCDGFYNYKKNANSLNTLQKSSSAINYLVHLKYNYLILWNQNLVENSQYNS